MTDFITFKNSDRPKLQVRASTFKSMRLSQSRKLQPIYTAIYMARIWIQKTNFTANSMN